jgi:hypothetical protein
MSDNPKDTEEKSTETTAEPETVLLSWVSHPARNRPLVTALVALFLVLLVFIVYSLTASIFFSGVAALILWGSLSQFFLPTRFTLTDKGVRVKYTVNKVAKDWNTLRSYYVDKHGVLLSPFVRPSRLESFRGVYVRFADNKDQILDVVKDKIEVVEDEI